MVSDRVLTAIITAAIGLGLLVAIRYALKVALVKYVERAGVRRPPEEVASLRTRLSVLQRVIVVFLAAVVVWSVLSIFPTTDRLAATLLASGAVVAVLFGLAFTTPLGNLGAGVLLAFAQPVRLGDRATVGEITGRVAHITLIHTILLTDDDRRVFVPNSQMVSSVVVNRTIEDPRRIVAVEVPVALGAPLDRARALVLDAARAAGRPLEDVTVRLTNLTERTAWLTLTAYAPPDANVPELAGDLRERAVAALAREELLPV